MVTNNSANYATGASGTVLTGNGVGVTPTFQSSVSSITINGDTGSVTGSTVSIKGSSTAGSTVSFQGSGTNMTLNVTASTNTVIGAGSGSGTLTNTTANTGLGNLVLPLANLGANNNTAIGYAALTSCDTGSSNTGIGVVSLSVVSSGIGNVGVGQNSLPNISTGNYNIAIGTSAGVLSSTSDSSNIYLGNQGVGGESHTMRLGETGSSNQQVSSCYIAGIVGITTSNTQMVTIDSTTGQLGAAAVVSSITTITGDSGGALSPTTGNVNIFGLSGVKTSGSGSTLTIKGPPFADASGSATSTLNTGEFVTGAFTRTLPASAGLADGDLFEYVCTSASQLTIQAVSAQKIRIGSAISSAAGTAKSNAIGDSLTLRFRAADGFFYATSVVGTWTTA